MEFRRSIEAQPSDRAVWLQSFRHNQHILRGLFTQLCSRAETREHGFTYALGPGAIAVQQQGATVAYWTNAGSALHFRFLDDRHCYHSVDSIDEAARFTCQIVRDARPS